MFRYIKQKVHHSLVLDTEHNDTLLHVLRTPAPENPSKWLMTPSS